MADKDLIGVIDVTCVLSPGGGHEAPGFASPFYRNNQTCSPNAELIGQWSEDDVKLVVDVTAGENSKYTQPTGLAGDYYLDVPQAYIEIGKKLYGGFGRHITKMGVDVLRSDGNDLIFRSMNFGLIPYTETGAWAGVREDNSYDVSFGAMPCPDCVANSHQSAYFVSNLSLTFNSASAFLNYQTGPGQDTASKGWKQTADFGVTLTSQTPESPPSGPPPPPSASYSLKLYYLISREPFDGVEQTLHGANIYATYRPADFSAAFVFRGGITQDDGGRTGVKDLRILELDAGVNLFLANDKVQLRIQVDQKSSLNNTLPFDGRSGQMRVGLQMLFASSLLK